MFCVLENAAWTLWEDRCSYLAIYLLHTVCLF